MTPARSTCPDTISAGTTATGARTLTLQGAGNLSISGTIQNGSASALSLVKTNSGSLTLSGTNTYTGATTNWGGNLLINGSLAGPLVFNGSILSGTGLVAGNTSIQGGELSPGSAVANSIGTLSFGGNLTLGPRIFTAIEISAAPQTNDQVSVAGTLTFGGTLYIGNVAGTLTSGQTFKLFSAGSYAGNFPTVSLPTLDAGLAWDTSGLATNGTISVAALPSVTICPAATNTAFRSTILLTALADGTPPLAYQWLDNQTNAMAGATNATLTLSQVTSAQAGNYTVLAANHVGTASAIAAVSVENATPPIITWSYTNFTFQLNWDYGTLQGATNAPGPYSDIPDAAAPYTIPATNAQQDHRLR